MRQGLIIKNTGNNSWVRFPDGAVEMCKIRGNFRLKGIKSTNPVVVGDWVEVDSSNFITEIRDRKNCLVRRSTNLSRQIHIIAANIDIALLVVTLKKPAVSTVFIDRFIASAEAFGVPVALVFNKIDLLENADFEYLDTIINLYKSIGYECLKCSATGSMANARLAHANDVGIENVKKLINGKTALLSGNSGVGKSTIINALSQNEVARTAQISEYHQKGMHTTTFSEIFCVDNQTFIIDTPGIKGFGTVDMQENEVGHFFREIFAASKHCRYPSCTHRNEPNCAVIQAISDKKIAQSRYQSYLSILEDVKQGKYR
ncbi:MAG: ribosome small subunit-dependent GTPase A [Prevotellaceae bacterium]|jgi:ribosome biogenesis GTPase|nr:ribosome small subunit-dependent GTPase A [Prevotellaceae bacterium]